MDESGARSWPERSERPRRARTLAVTGGKGGVGKSSLAVNLALAVAGSGRRVLLVDADLGLASADLLLGLTPRATLAEVALDGLPIGEALVNVAPGFDLLPGASGVGELADLSPVGREQLIASLGALDDDYDLIVVDTAAGAGQGVRAFLRAADRVLVVASPDPAAVTDAYALVKLLTGEGRTGIALAINMARSEDEGRRIGERVAQVARRYLGVDLDVLGSVPFDWQAAAAVRARRPLLLASPQAPASAAVRRLAERVGNWALPSAGVSRERRGLVGLLSRAVGM